jgi:hypothetical protein
MADHRLAGAQLIDRMIAGIGDEQLAIGVRLPAEAA